MLCADNLSVSYFVSYACGKSLNPKVCPQEGDKEKERMDAAKAKVAEVLEGMQADVKAAGGRVKELSAELRSSERDSRESTKAGAHCFLPGRLCNACCL